jgi:tetratricopeptide (TPR) repeat protein
MTRKRSTLRLATLASLIAAPIIASGPASAVDDDTTAGSTDLTSVRTKISAGNYAAALEELRGLAEDNQEADVYNLLGFTLRKTGDYATSLSYYKKALELRPDFKPAHEYLGELYAETGHPGEARAELAELARLCPAGCEERADLEKALGARSPE